MTANIDAYGVLHMDFTDKELETFTETNKDTAMKCAKEMMIERDKTQTILSTNYTKVQLEYATLQERYAEYMNGLPYTQRQK